MRRIFNLIILSGLMLGCIMSVSAADARYVAGKDLTLINKTIETPNRYSRVDTTKYDGFTDTQRRNLTQVSAGLALAFKTNSPFIYVKPDYRPRAHSANQTYINQAGFDLYIKKNGKWLYAGSNALRGGSDHITLVENMASGEKECLLYLPNYTIVDEVNVGVAPDAVIEAMPNPFRHKVVVFGSSYTHGSGCSRPGMTYPHQLARATGLQMCGFGMSGNSMLQQSYARVLADTQADAFLFDAFSNPNATQIAERFTDFVKTIRAKHPDTPLIFMQTIYRQNRNFDTRKDAAEAAKMTMAEKVVKEAMKTDRNIYWLVPNTGSQTSTVDGVHPGDLGYTCWMESIRKPLVKILAKYNIK